MLFEKDSGGGTTVIYQIDNSGVERLLTEQNELLREQKEMLETQWEFLQEQRQEQHSDAQVIMASLWLLCGLVVGAAVGLIVYRLWGS